MAAPVFQTIRSYPSDSGSPVNVVLYPPVGRAHATLRPLHIALQAAYKIDAYPLTARLLTMLRSHRPCATLYEHDLFEWMAQYDGFFAIRPG